jgi:hypothetical protein
MWALEEVRRRTLRLIEGLDQRVLDWEGPDGRENGIGSLLYHIAIAEIEWLFLDIQGRDFDPSIRRDFPYPAEDDHGRLTRVAGVPLIDHVGRLQHSRAIFLETFRAMSLGEWHRLRHPYGMEDHEVTPAWATFHLVEHEAGHAFQISTLKARAARFFASPQPAGPGS